MGFFKEDIAKIKAFVFDVDGVLSAGEILLNEQGELLRTTNTKDGFALQFAIRQGFPVGIITGGNSEGVATRYRNLGVEHIYLRSKDKKADLADFIEKTGVSRDEILYMGDDLPDYEVMQAVGMPTCPKDAVHQIKAVASYISDLKGGQGCVRDVIEQTLRAQKKWKFQDMKNLANS
ncbi:3-deoxy-D-manno-octulosonate 8-phosphate phosphatase (KDO 8-P phosphatase) [Balneicella halophila]|uniref:3-deoxy-D-manno-octulosonate 8-phosphate phosphatase (KDO 8-P phosphatase) n=1 Tax=Balneicella halophila TaxID=1537566 RepID=A0A7L4UQH0_BALHA|nr:HAD family hydrolase [Balneicella halophila]PVX52028.1 3-deoxy-D-manno-octulosonate 8-phosphate phosphatase (KDO 8-P phosphatase) [Balneicella halophila]